MYDVHLNKFFLLREKSQIELHFLTSFDFIALKQ